MAPRPSAGIAHGGDSSEQGHKASGKEQQGHAPQDRDTGEAVDARHVIQQQPALPLPEHATPPPARAVQASISPVLTPSILTTAPELHFHHGALRPRKVKPLTRSCPWSSRPRAPALPQPVPSLRGRPSTGPLWLLTPQATSQPEPSPEAQCHCHAHPSLPNPTSRAWPPLPPLPGLRLRP